MTFFLATIPFSGQVFESLITCLYTKIIPIQSVPEIRLVTHSNLPNGKVLTLLRLPNDRPRDKTVPIVHIARDFYHLKEVEQCRQTTTKKLEGISVVMPNMDGNILNRSLSVNRC